MPSTAKESGSLIQGNTLEQDAWELHEALSELVRVYQFRDRKRICYQDVSITQCYAIDALSRLGTMSLNMLAAELFLDKSTTSRVVDSLERKGYVKRSADPKDGRALRLEVTQRGKDLHDRIEKELAGEMKKMITDFDPDIRQATIRLVARLARAASKRFSSP
ncbi:MAG: MarR family transcriptional regulator [Gemmatimonadota bacterium]|nr:MAG: MarR family transcriptional regulator [Gemmatimonadota bacterium]